MTTTTETPAPARAGRERTCIQCGSTYRSPRNNSRYCSNACRCRAKRGYSPKASASSGTDGFSVIGKLLLRLNLAGPISQAAKLFGLTVDEGSALAELQQLFNRKGWGFLSEHEFRQALAADGIRRWRSTSPEAAERNRWQTRQRVRAERQQCFS